LNKPAKTNKKQPRS